jgi:hypothetical protein
MIAPMIPKADWGVNMLISELEAMKFVKKFGAQVVWKQFSNQLGPALHIPGE